MRIAAPSLLSKSDIGQGGAAGLQHVLGTGPQVAAIPSGDTGDEELDREHAGQSLGGESSRIAGRLFHWSGWSGDTRDTFCTIRWPTPYPPRHQECGL